MAKLKRTGYQWVRTDNRLFTLDVLILEGPLTEAFVQANPIMCRTIQIRADQTLEDLHHAIFDAFDREDEHWYEFQVGGDAPQDPKAKRYVLPAALHANDTFSPGLLDGDPQSTPPQTIHATIGSLGLQVKDIIGYWFDFGDDWWHQINVVAIEDKAGKGKYPRITNRIGASPPQYVDWDEEDDLELDDDEMDAEDYDPSAHLKKLKAQVPDHCVERFVELVQLTDTFCDKHLNAGYQMHSREMLAELCLQDVPLHKGKPQSWTAGVVYVIGQANFLGDPSFEPYMKSEDLAKQMGVSIATVHAKAAIIRKVVEISPLEPRWLMNGHPTMQVMQGLVGQFLAAHPELGNNEAWDE